MIISSKYYSFHIFAVILSEVVYLDRMIQYQQVPTASLIISQLCIHLFILTRRFGKGSGRHKFCNATGDKMSWRCTYVCYPREVTSLDNCSVVMLACKNMPLLDIKKRYLKTQVFFFHNACLKCSSLAENFNDILLTTVEPLPKWTWNKL